MKQSLYSRARWLLASNTFFVGLVIVFVLQSTWIALSGVYPMAFDEDFHLGIIRLYAHKWLPFFAHQPAHADQFGAVTRDPSYLYHYLMSFPDRIVTHLSSSQTVEVLSMRFIDIALFAWALVLFRKLLLKTKAPITWIHLALLYFIMIPVVPLLAAQINYDDLLIPLTALNLLWTIEFVQTLRHDKKLRLGRLSVIVTLGILTSLVKYTFLPFFAVMLLYLLIELVRAAKVQRLHIVKLLQQAWRPLSLGTKVLLVVPLLVAVGLFLERDGYNTIKYATPAPECNQVLGVPACQAYGPWARNYLYAQTKASVDVNPLRFSASWFYGLFERSFFAVNGPGHGYTSNHPIPILAVSSIVVGSGGVLLFVYYRRRLLEKHPYLKFLIIASLAYIAVLWLQNYSDFLHLGQTAAINGRYLFPALPPLLLGLALAYREWLRPWPAVAKGGLVALAFLLFLQGAGTLTFIIRSNADWYWPGNRPITDVNQWARDGLHYVVVR